MYKIYNNKKINNNKEKLKVRKIRINRNEEIKNSTKKKKLLLNINLLSKNEYINKN